MHFIICQVCVHILFVNKLYRELVVNHFQHNTEDVPLLFSYSSPILPF